MKIDDITVIDAKRPLKIAISHGDVVRGRTKAPTSCAAAKACLRQLPDCTEVRVHLGRTFIKLGDKKLGDKWVRYLTPHSLRSEIIAFDRGAQFAEGEYTLISPRPSEKLGHGRSGSDTNRSRPKALHKKRKYHVVKGVRPFFKETHFSRA